MYWIFIAQTFTQKAGKVVIEVATLFSKMELVGEDWTGKSLVKFSSAPVAVVVKKLAETCPKAVICLCKGVNAQGIGVATLRASGRSVLLEVATPVELTHACLQRSLDQAVVITPAETTEEATKPVVLVEEPTPAPAATSRNRKRTAVKA